MTWESKKYLFSKFTLNTMPLYVNDIFLAEKLRTYNEASFLQSHRILPSANTCPECNLTCKEAKLKHGTNYFYFHCCPGCSAQTSLTLLLFLLFCLSWSFAGPEPFFLTRESCWKPLLWWSKSLLRWHWLWVSDSPTIDSRGGSAMWWWWWV